jgi:hypothetical protein
MSVLARQLSLMTSFADLKLGRQRKGGDWTVSAQGAKAKRIAPWLDGPNMLPCEGGRDAPELDVRSEKQVGQNYENPDLCGHPTERPYTGRREGIGGNIEDPRDDKDPGPEHRQRSGGLGGMHKEQCSRELRKYLEKVSMGANQSVHSGP